MPTYVYRRADGTTFEVEQRITEDALATCPTTGQPVTRVITGGTGLIFKGSGFYLTDYARGNGSADKSPAAKTDASEKTGDSGEKSTSSSEKNTSTETTTTKKSDG